MSCHNVDYRQAIQIFKVYSGNLNFQTKATPFGDTTFIHYTSGHFKNYQRVKIDNSWCDFS